MRLWHVWGETVPLPFCNFRCIAVFLKFILCWIVYSVCCVVLDGDAYS